jgi:hypothetical protein
MFSLESIELPVQRQKRLIRENKNTNNSRCEVKEERHDLGRMDRFCMLNFGLMKRIVIAVGYHQLLQCVVLVVELVYHDYLAHIFISQ